MAQVTIRNLDDETARILKTRAKLHHRPLESELRVILAEAAREPATLIYEVDQIAHQLEDHWQGDSTALIREDRDR